MSHNQQRRPHTSAGAGVGSNPGLALPNATAAQPEREGSKTPTPTTARKDKGKGRAVPFQVPFPSAPQQARPSTANPLPTQGQSHQRGAPRTVRPGVDVPRFIDGATDHSFLMPYVKMEIEKGNGAGVEALMFHGFHEFLVKKGMYRAAFGLGLDVSEAPYDSTFKATKEQVQAKVTGHRPPWPDSGSRPGPMFRWFEAYCRKVLFPRAEEHARIIREEEEFARREAAARATGLNSGLGLGNDYAGPSNSAQSSSRHMISFERPANPDMVEQTLPGWGQLGQALESQHRRYNSMQSYFTDVTSSNQPRPITANSAATSSQEPPSKRPRTSRPRAHTANAALQSHEVQSHTRSRALHSVPEVSEPPTVNPSAAVSPLLLSGDLDSSSPDIPLALASRLSAPHVQSSHEGGSGPFLFPDSNSGQMLRPGTAPGADSAFNTRYQMAAVFNSHFHNNNPASQQTPSAVSTGTHSAAVGQTKDQDMEKEWNSMVEDLLFAPSQGVPPDYTKSSFGASSKPASVSFAAPLHASSASTSEGVQQAQSCQQQAAAGTSGEGGPADAPQNVPRTRPVITHGWDYPATLAATRAAHGAAGTTFSSTPFDPSQSTSAPLFPQNLQQQHVPQPMNIDESWKWPAPMGNVSNSDEAGPYPFAFGNPSQSIQTTQYQQQQTSDQSSQVTQMQQSSNMAHNNMTGGQFPFPGSSQGAQGPKQQQDQNWQPQALYAQQGSGNAGVALYPSNFLNALQPAQQQSFGQGWQLPQTSQMPQGSTISNYPTTFGTDISAVSGYASGSQDVSGNTLIQQNYQQNTNNDWNMPPPLTGHRTISTGSSDSMQHTQEQQLAAGQPYDAPGFGAANYGDGMMTDGAEFSEALKAAYDQSMGGWPVPE